MMLKAISTLLISALFFTSCQHESESTRTNGNEFEKHNELRMDSLEDLADKIRDKSPAYEPSVIVKFVGDWLADKNLNTIRRVILENTTDKKVVGVKLAYGTGMSKEFDNRNVGRFKVAIKPHGKTVLQIQAKRFGVSDDVVENPSYTSLMFHDSIAVSIVYFSDGTTRVD